MKVAVVLIFLAFNHIITANRSLSPIKVEPSKTVEALNGVLKTASDQNSFIILVTPKDKPFMNANEVISPWGLGVFEVDNHNANQTQTQLSRMVDHTVQLVQVSWSVTVVVVSDDPAFIASFTQWSIEGRLLVWSTRLLILTRLPLQQLSHIRHTLAMTNSMVIVLNDLVPVTRCKVFVHLPYNTPEADAIMVARWSYIKGLQMTSHLHLFPHKFNTLSTHPAIKVAYIKMPTTKIRIVDDPDAPGGKRVITLSPEITLIETIAQAMNFTLNMMTPVDGSWGKHLPNGEWNGIIGMAVRKESDLALGLFQITLGRAQAVDFTFPAFHSYLRIVARRGRPEVDPWGFLLPMGPVVWVAIFVALIAVVAGTIILSYFLPDYTLCGTRKQNNISTCVRVALHQDVINIYEWWWWERVVLGVWMLMMLVLWQSYAGNLMSLLAVRYIPLPIQSLKDIVHSTASVLVPGSTQIEHAFVTATSGVNKEIGDLRNVGRFVPISTSTYVKNLDTVVRDGTAVLITAEARTKILIAQDFSRIGSCDFYLAREEFLPVKFAMAGHRGSPLVPAVSRVLMRVVEAGLYRYWLQSYTPNFTSCLKPPTKVAVRTSLAVNNIWGMLAVMFGGGLISVLLFGIEILYNIIIPQTVS